MSKESDLIENLLAEYISNTFLKGIVLSIEDLNIIFKGKNIDKLLEKIKNSAKFYITMATGI